MYSTQNIEKNGFQTPKDGKATIKKISSLKGKSINDLNLRLFKWT